MSQGAVLRTAKEVEENYPEMQSNVTLEGKLVFENCKQFAEYCKVGPVMKEVSFQIQFARISIQKKKIVKSSLNVLIILFLESCKID